MVQNRQNVNLYFLVKFGHFCDFFQSPLSREIYVRWSSNQDKNAFQGLKKLFEGNLVIRPAIIGIWLFARANILHVFSREIYVQWNSNEDKNAFQGLKKLFEGNLLFARRTLESDYAPGWIYFMYFLEKYTSCMKVMHKNTSNLKKAINLRSDLIVQAQTEPTLKLKLLI